MKKLIAMIICTCLLLSTFTACSNKKTTTDSSDKPKTTANEGSDSDEEKVTIRFSHQWAEENRLPYWDALVQGYMEEHPNVNIETEVMPNETYKEKIKIMLGGNDMPDLFFTFDGAWVKRFAEHNAIMDLTPYLDADPDFRDAFNQGVLTTGQVDGKQYSLPIRTCVNFMLYNKDIFAQYNLSVPTTWAEFMDVCQTLKDHGVTPIAMGDGEQWAAAHYVSALNVQLVPFDTLENDYYLNSGEFIDRGYVEALQLVKDMNDKGYFMDGMPSTAQTLAREMFVAGQAAMIYDQCASFKNQYLDKMGGDNWDIFPLPVVEGASGDLDMMVAWIDQFAISSQCEHPEVVIDFLKYFYNETNQKKMQDELGFVSTVNAVSQDTDNSFPQLIKAMDVINQCKGFISVIDVEMDGAVASVYQASIQEMFTSKTPEQVMQNVREEAQRVMSE